MASIQEIRDERVKKLNILKERGINPYPASFDVSCSIEETIKDFKKISKKKSVTLAGRITAIRGQGALVFLNINDGTGIFQAMLKKGETDDKSLELFSETVDIGDFAGFKGKLFITKRGEKTLLAKEWTMLAKSLRQLPDKWHGLQDTEERLRRRYLDTLMSPESKGKFLTKSKIITQIRAFLNEAGYLEVETPVLQPVYGGATALPFTTHHNALDIDLYLRISPELYLKRLLVGGFPKVYELSRNFRNEGISPTHNPEFTMLEFYEIWSDSKKQMAFVEKMTKSLVKNIFKKNHIVYGEQKIDFSKKFAVVSYFDLLKRYALIPNPEKITKEEAYIKATQLAIEVSKGDSLEKILDHIYKKSCRPKLVDPTFIIDFPEHYLPLAKKKEGVKGIVDAFQLVISGIEIVKAFSELNDPLDQRERFEKQEEYKKEGDKEAQEKDEDFLEAMEYGMPPAGGVGIGIDRLTMLLTDSKNIRDVILFPTMRPRGGE